MQTPRLHAVQRALSARILSHYRPEVANLGGLLRRPPGGDLDRRLALYGEGYAARVGEALAETYPALAHLSGAGAFAAMVARYCGVGAIRSSYNLSDAGAELAEFLDADRLGEELPFAADLARLEWKIARAFHAELRTPFDSAAAATWTALDWQRARLCFQPSLAVVRSPWPIETLWRLRDVPVPDIDIEIEGCPQFVLVFRSGLDVCVESIDAVQATAIEALMAGECLGAVAERLDASGCAPGGAFTWLVRFQPHGIVTGTRPDVDG